MGQFPSSSFSEGSNDSIARLMKSGWHIESIAGTRTWDATISRQKLRTMLLLYSS
jgi:hypothetical protein